MKTKVKTSILAIALLASVTGAFASKANLSSKNLAPYTWQKYQPDGVTPTGSPVAGTEANPFPEQCEGSANICAIGTPDNQSNPTLTLRYQ